MDGETQVTDQMVGISWHGELPWGSNDLTSEKPVLHYITHTYSCRKQSRLEVSAANTCKQTRSRLDAGRSPEGGTHPSVHETRGNHHPFPRIPPVPLLRSGESQPRKVAPG